MTTEIKILMEKQKEEKKKEEIWTLFIDLKSAFDTVDHEILFEKMKRLQIDQKLTNTI